MFLIHFLNRFRATLLSSLSTALLLGTLGGITIDLAKAETPQFTPQQIEFFEKEVRPLLSQHCYECHSSQAKKLQAGLFVDSRASLIEGGDSGASIEPGDPDGSLLMEAVRWESYEMPPKGKLPDHEVAILEKWIRQGAPWPPENARDRVERPEFDLSKRAAEHWAWQPIQRSPAPPVATWDWPYADLDRFILKKLEENDLTPADDAERSALLRRLYFDLIGLPPSPDETRTFLADHSPKALERVVDTLLDSPHFGERWGRHWLDLVRYAESRGHEFDDDAVNAFQYRDYVIRAFNADVPYDQLVREHLAGDLIAEPRVHPQEGFNESVLGTGFWFLGEWVHSPVDTLKDESDRFDNMIDVMSKTFLGVTVACARCHDHKFDAISTADYYSLTGFLQSSDYRQVRFESMEQNRKVAQQLTETDTAFRRQVEELLAAHHVAPPTHQPLPKAVEGALVLDYGNLKADEYLQDGYIFGQAPWRHGEPWLDTSGEDPEVRFHREGHAGNDPIWNGLVTVKQPKIRDRCKLSHMPRSGRTLRTPTFELTGETVGCRLRGEGHVITCVDSHRHVAGPLHKETIKTIKSGSTSVVLNLARYVGHRIHLEFTPAEGAQLQIAWVVQGSPEETRHALAASAPSDAQAWDEFSRNLKSSAGDELDHLADKWAESRAQLRSRITTSSQTAMAMMDGTGEDARVLIRGNPAKPDKVVSRHFLSAIAGDAPMVIQQGSGRLELAKQINAPDNPLTSRVIVNRIWHHLMGRGIVPTTDDFGVLGKRPTHPELLDHLAARFLADRRSIKQLIRYIALSRTYRMSSKSMDVAMQTDPENLLWHHRSPKRLEGEAVRDSLLAVSGKLNRTMLGPPVPIHLTPFMDGRGRPKSSGPIDGDGRRSIYVSVRRNFLSPFMLAFDVPAPFSTMGRRTVSNVPAQALILMNDPFVAQQARGWAERAMEEEASSTARIRWMYLSAFARYPTHSELEVATEFLGASPDVSRWADFAHALINTKEFIFLR